MEPLLSETEIFFLFDIKQKIMVNTAHSDLTRAENNLIYSLQHCRMMCALIKPAKILSS